MAAWLPYFIKESDNIIRRSSLFSQNTDTSFPESNLAELPVSKPWRTKEGKIANQKLLIDLPSTSDTVNIIAVIGHNLTSSSTITVRAGTSADPDGTSFSQTLTWRERSIYALISPAQTFKFWSIEFTDTANPDGLIKVGYLLMGNATQMNFGFDLGLTIEPYNVNRVNVTGFSTTAKISNLATGETFRLSFSNIDKTDGETLFNLLEDLRQNKEPVLFFANSGDPDEAVFGRLEGSSPSLIRVLNNISSIRDVTIREESSGIVVVDKWPIWEPGFIPGHSLPTGWTFTRSDTTANASYMDRDGVLKYAASGALRSPAYFNFGSGLYGALIEPSRTNGLLQSENFADVYWSKVQCTVTSDATTAPDGTVTADKIVEDLTNNLHDIQRGPLTVTDNTPQAFSIFAKAAERTWVYIRTLHSDGSSASAAWYDLANGVVGTVQPDVVAKIEKWGNGWYRLLYVRTAGLINASSVFVQFGITTSDNILSYQGDGVSGAYFWGAQFEQDQKWPTSYIPTGSTTATRAEEELVGPWGFIPQPMTAYTNVVRMDAQQSVSVEKRFLSIGGWGLDPRFLVRIALSGSVNCFWSDDATGISVSQNTSDWGDVIESAGLVQSNLKAGLQTSKNGADLSKAESVSSNDFIPSAWASPDEIQLRKTGQSFFNDSMLYRAVKVVRGEQTLDFMRKLKR